MMEKNKTNKAENIILVILIVLLPLSLLGYKAISIDSYKKAPADTILNVQDLKSLYEDSNDEQVIYMTVGRVGEGIDSEHTWSELNSHDLAWYEENDEKKYRCDALIQFGNEEGPTSGSFGFEDVGTNATVKISGTKASTRQQKNYHITINEGSGSISGIKSFTLSKSFSDPFRFSNRLCFDLMSEIEEMMSTRTRFVHLYVRDETEEADSLFVDYGLYTMIESIDKRYLKNRGLDKSGELYKVVNFDFGRHEDVIMQPTNPGYDKDKFEELLEVKGSNDYSQFLKMLDVVNDPSIPIEDIVKEYFSKDNLYTWMAFNILMDNKDTDTENFYLYCSTGTKKFYILPWDYDGVLRSDYELLRDADYSPGWEKGIFLYTESKLFSRMMKSQHCLNELSEYVTKLHESVLSEENIMKKVEEYSKLVKKHLYSLPDMGFARVSKDNYDKLIEKLREQIDTNFYAYYDSIETPWPFHILEPEKQGGNVVVRWEESYFIGGECTYSVTVSDSWDFKENIIDEHNVTGTELKVGKLETGQYFVRVTADTPAGHSQEAYEIYNTEKKTTVHGILCFYVMENGTVVQSVF